VSARTTATLLLALACTMPAIATAQTSAPTTQATPGSSGGPSKLWLVAGGTATTLRGDCQEDCPAHGTGSYLHTGSVKGLFGMRVNSQTDAGVEISWVPATTALGEETRTTFILGAAQIRPWASQGLFLNAGMGMAFVRNFGFETVNPAATITSKALALTYGIGWTFRHDERLGLQIFGAQHMAAVGDFQTGGLAIENVIVNYWSIGAAIVLR